jgi:hypothetical protein
MDQTNGSAPSASGVIRKPGISLVSSGKSRFMFSAQDCQFERQVDVSLIETGPVLHVTTLHQPTHLRPEFMMGEVSNLIVAIHACVIERSSGTFPYKSFH